MNEQLKQPLMFGAIGMGITVMAYQLIFNSGTLFRLSREASTFGGIFTGLLLGLVVGGAIFGVAYLALRNR
ncbi:MAG: hypothetical protein KDA41_11455 [Planctomycetales bacterium]|nr:hypothetical protein [Planctomycetales bacterium]